MKLRIKETISRYRELVPILVWVVALVSTAGSLVLSEIYHLIPCALCWWQRVLMYPLVVIVAVGILKQHSHWAHYTLPLALGGVLVAGYHSLLQWKILPEAITACNAFVSCVTPQINWLGFITIPFMSFKAFAVIALLTAAYIWTAPEGER